ncbi:MAG: ATP-dependent zinc metalloprotease FtsH [bacterium]|nr:ATP-dependent zinc metalloprotease FtsH [bacterium]
MFPPNQNPRNPNDRPEEPGQQPPSPLNQIPRWLFPVILIVLLLWALNNAPEIGNMLSSDAPISIPYSAVYELVEAYGTPQTEGETRSSSITIQAVIDNDSIALRFSEPVTYPVNGSPLLDQGVERGQYSAFNATQLPINDPELAATLRQNGVTLVGQFNQPNLLLSILLNFAPFLLLLGFLIWSARGAQRQMTGVFGFGRTQAREYNREKPKITFVDVAGQEAAKSELVEIVDFLREPDKYIALGARIPRGVLLVGPPGTGKTLLARAVAGEANVAFFSIAASEFVEMFVGVGASRVRDLFNKAKASAPSIVFIDEIDAVGRQRGAGLGGGNDEREQTLNQMLAEMDGFDQTESVIVMAATNRPDVLDPALLRPGRFDRQVTVALPDRQGRHDILKVHTRGKPLASDIDLMALARATIGFSGADIANLANEAALSAARGNRKKITSRDFSDAFDRIVLGTQSPPLSNENERRVVAYHEAGHALVAALTPGTDPVFKVTIVPRGQALGVTAMLPEDDRRNYSRTELLKRMVVLLGGRAAEQVTFGEITSGASNDLRRVTQMARQMVAQLGMSDRLGQVNFGDDERQPFLGYSLSQGRNYSEETASQIDAEVRRLVDESYDEALALLQANRDKLDNLANELLTNEIVERPRVLEIAGVAPDPEAEVVPIPPPPAGD